MSYFLLRSPFRSPQSGTLISWGIQQGWARQDFFLKKKSNYGIIRTTPKKFPEVRDAKKRSVAEKSQKRIESGKQARTSRACRTPGPGLGCECLSACFGGKVRVRGTQHSPARTLEQYLGLLPEARAFSVIREKAKLQSLRPEPQRRALGHAGPARPLQEARTYALSSASPSPVSTSALKRPVFSFRPIRAAPRDWRRDPRNAMCLRPRTHSHSFTEDAFQPTQGLQTLGRSWSVPYCT